MKILLVEDDSDILEFEEFCFQKYFNSAQIYLAKNGLEAFDLCKVNTFDFVLTDINMPIMDGFTFIEKVSKEYPNSFKKMYVLSGCLSNESYTNKNNRINKFFSKPMNYELLVVEIDEDLKI